MNPAANLLKGDRGISRQLENAIELVGEGDVVLGAGRVGRACRSGIRGSPIDGTQDE